MELPPDDLAFLAGLVKASRQRIHFIHWTDRDGTNRITALSAAELERVNALAARAHTNKGDLLRQVAHVPVAKLMPKERPARPEGTPDAQ